MNKELKRIQDKKYYQSHKQRIKERGKIYRESHKEENKERDRKYRQSHKKQYRERNKKYRELHKKQSREWQKKYYRLHKEQIKKKKYEYHHTPQGKKVVKRYVAKHRGLGFIPLNQPFEGCEGHHIDFQRVIYIPKILHRSVWHSVNLNINMDKINKIAFDYFKIESKAGI